MGTVNEELDLVLLAKLLHGHALPLELLDGFLTGFSAGVILWDCYS